MNLTQITTVSAALGAATFGGVLFAFSTFVMPGLDASPPSAAVATMQQINRAAPRSLLAFDMVATLALCVVVGVLAVLQLRRGGGPGSVLLLVGSAMYVVSFAITAIYHIPRNNAFDSVVASGPGSVLLLVGAAMYVVSFAITAVYHIPRNNAFDSVVASGPHAAQAWHDYARPWELWNHVRAGAALAGAASMVVGLMTRSA